MEIAKPIFYFVLAGLFEISGGYLFKEKMVDPGTWPITNHANPLYLGLVAGGVVLSRASLGLLNF